MLFDATRDIFLPFNSISLAAALIKILPFLQYNTIASSPSPTTLPLLTDASYPEYTSKDLFEDNFPTPPL